MAAVALPSAALGAGGVKFRGDIENGSSVKFKVQKSDTPEGVQRYVVDFLANRVKADDRSVTSCLTWNLPQQFGLA